MPSDKPLFSVIIPAYNAEKTLWETVESVLRQDCTDFELVIIDDGSTDSTPEIAVDIARAEARVRVLTQANGGVSSARNHGLRIARGEIVAFLDADDLWCSTKLATHAERFLERPEIEVAYARIRFMSPDGAPMAVTSSAPRGDIDLVTLLAENVTCTTSNLLVRREAALRVGGFDETLDFDEDKEWLCRAHCAGLRFDGLDAVLTRYRTSPAGLASNIAGMEQDWERFVDMISARMPAQVRGIRGIARALFLRNLSRRALRLGVEDHTALGLWCRAIRSAPRAILVEPRRWMLTGAVALATCLTPRALATPLLSRIDRVPSRLEEITR